MMHVLKRAAVGSGAQSERVAATSTTAAAAAVGGDRDVESSLALPVVDVKGSRRPFLVHERLGFIHGGG